MIFFLASFNNRSKKKLMGQHVFRPFLDIFPLLYFIESWVVVNTEAQDNAESYTDEVESLRAAIVRYEDERRLLRDEIVQLKDMLKREVAQAEADTRRNTTIIADYKKICQRLDDQLADTKMSLNALRVGRF